METDMQIMSYSCRSTSGIWIMDNLGVELYTFMVSPSQWDFTWPIGGCSFEKCAIMPQGTHQCVPFSRYSYMYTY